MYKLKLVTLDKKFINNCTVTIHINLEMESTPYVPKDGQIFILLCPVIIFTLFCYISLLF